MNTFNDRLADEVLNGPIRSAEPDREFTYERLLEMVVAGQWGKLFAIAEHGSVGSKENLVEVTLAIGDDRLWEDNSRLQSILGFPVCPSCNKEEMTDDSDEAWTCDECGEKFTTVQVIDGWLKTRTS